MAAFPAFSFNPRGASAMSNIWAREPSQDTPTSHAWRDWVTDKVIHGPPGLQPHGGLVEGRPDEGWHIVWKPSLPMPSPIEVWTPEPVPLRNEPLSLPHRAFAWWAVGYLRSWVPLLWVCGAVYTAAEWPFKALYSSLSPQAQRRVDAVWKSWVGLVLASLFGISLAVILLVGFGLLMHAVSPPVQH
jgi:hypothetical protein